MILHLKDKVIIKHFLKSCSEVLDCNLVVEITCLHKQLPQFIKFYNGDLDFKILINIDNLNNFNNEKFSLKDYIDINFNDVDDNIQEFESNFENIRYQLIYALIDGEIDDRYLKNYFYTKIKEISLIDNINIPMRDLKLVNIIDEFTVNVINKLSIYCAYHNLSIDNIFDKKITSANVS